MGSEAEPRTATAPKLSLLSIPPISTKMEEELSGTMTPPFNASAAIPFLWEEEPGKPRPCIALTTTPSPSLEPPPRMFPKQASPTTVLEGPYVKKRPKASSFRMTPKESSNSHNGGSLMSPAPESVLLVSKRWLSRDKVCFLGPNWTSKRRKLGKIISEDHVAVHGSPFDSLHSDSDDDDEADEVNQWSSSKSSGAIASARKNNTKTGKSHFWAAIYGGLKQVIPWKAKKVKDHDAVN